MTNPGSPTKYDTKYDKIFRSTVDWATSVIARSRRLHKPHIRPGGEFPSGTTPMELPNEKRSWTLTFTRHHDTTTRGNGAQT
jgi:hypothetical protein